MSYRLLLAALVALPVSGFRAAAQGGGDTLALSLEAAVTRALVAGDETRLASAATSVAEAQITTARAAGLPQLRLNGGYTQVVKNARGTIVGSVFGQNYTYTTTLGVEQTLFQGGRILAASRAAGDVRRAALYSEEDTKQRVALDAQRSYLAVLLARQLEDIQRRNLALASDRLEQVEQLERAGRAARYDVLRSRVERANLEPLLIQASSDVTLAEIELKRLLNIPVDQPVLLTSALDLAAVDSVAAALAADSLRRDDRPSIRAAQSALDARREAVKVARADWLPTISAFFNTGYLALPANGAFPTVWGRSSPSLCPPGSADRSCQNDGWFANRSFGLTFSWPLFDGLRTKGNLDLAQAQAHVAELELTRERETAEQERAAARAGYARARGAWDAQIETVAEAEEAFQLATLRFERGVGTQLETSDAQFALLAARVNQARASFELYLAAAEIVRAGGRSTPLPPTRSISR